MAVSTGEACGVQVHTGERIPDFAADRYEGLRDLVGGRSKKHSVRRLEIAFLFFQHGKNQEFIRVFVGITQSCVSDHIRETKKALKRYGISRSWFIDQLN